MSLPAWTRTHNASLHVLAVLVALLAITHGLAAFGVLTPWVPWALLLPAAGLHLVWSLDAQPHAAPRTLRIAVVLAWGLLVLSPVLFSDDLWRYLLDGRLTRAGLSPFAYPPASPKIADLASDLLPLINHPQMPTVYPPLAQGLFAVGAWTAVTWKAMLAGFVGLGCWVLTRTSQDRPLGWLLASHPLVLVAAGGSGHVDAAGLPLVAAALIALRTQRPFRAAGWLGAAASLKLFPALLPALAGFGRPQRTRWALAAALPFAVLLVTYVPWVLGAAPAFGSLATYSATWTFHGAAHQTLVGVTHTALQSIGVAETVRLDGFWALGRSGASDGGAASLHLARDEVAAQLARLVTGLLLVVGGLAIGCSRARPELRLLRVMGLFLLLSPVLHPWYFLWLLPLALKLRSGWALLACASSVLPWVTTVRYLGTGAWVEVPGLAALQLLAILGFGAWWSQRMADGSTGSGDPPSSAPSQRA